MPTRIPIYRDDMFERMDRDKAELKKEMNDLTLLILAKLESCVYEPKEFKRATIVPLKKK